MFLVCKIVVLVLAALLAIGKVVLTIAGIVDKPGKTAWRNGEKTIVNDFFDALINLTKKK